MRSRLAQIGAQVLSLVVVLAAPAVAWATPYGTAGYNSNTYDGTLHLGPITLPDTGSAVLLAVGLAALVVAGCLLASAWRRRRAAGRS